MAKDPDALLYKILKAKEQMRLAAPEKKDYEEVELLEGGYVRLVSGGECALSQDKVPMAPGVFELTDHRKLVIGIGGEVLKIIPKGQGDAEGIAIVRKLKKFEQEEKEDKLRRLYNNIQEVKFSKQ